MKYLPFLLFLVVACKSNNHAGNKVTSADTPFALSDTADVAVSKQALQHVCKHIIYDSLSAAKMKEWKAENPGFTSIESFKFFFNNKKKWDANTPLVTALGLPEKAVIIEKALLKGVKNREVILWMDNPGVHFTENSFSCPERTIGVGQFVGKVNISLIDNLEKKIINTVVATDYEDKPDDCYQLPFLFDNENMAYYSFSPSGYKGFSKVTLLKFSDFDNDGLPYEFCFYRQEGCSMASKTLFSYNIALDSIFNYAVDLKYIDYDSIGKIDTVTYGKNLWVDYGFVYPSAQKPSEFALGIYMTLGTIINNGLPVVKLYFDKNERVIKGTWEFYPQDYVLKNDTKFNKYFPDEE